MNPLPALREWSFTPAENVPRIARRPYQQGGAGRRMSREGHRSERGRSRSPRAGQLTQVTTAMSRSTTQKNDIWDRIMRPWWAKIVIGLVMLLTAWWQYVDFSKLESGERNSLLIGRTTKVLYDVGGKWLPTSLALLAGVAFIAWGVVQVMRAKR